MILDFIMISTLKSPLRPERSQSKLMKSASFLLPVLLVGIGVAQTFFGGVIHIAGAQ